MGLGVMKQGTPEEYVSLLHKVTEYRRKFNLTITFRDLGYWTMASPVVIPTVGNTFAKMLFGSGPKHRVSRHRVIYVLAEPSLVFRLTS